MFVIIDNRADRPVLASPETFATADAARVAVATAAPAAVGATIHRWYGTVDSATTAYRVDAGVIVLPESAAGCRPEHAPLLDIFQRFLGTGVPLDALHEYDQPDTWTFAGGADLVVAVTLRAATDSEGRRYWRADDSCQDDGSPWPDGCNPGAPGGILEAAEEYAREWYSPPEPDDEDGTEYGSIYVPLDDDGDPVDGASDDGGDAEECAREYRESARYGYPWAWNWAFFVDDPRNDVATDLIAAGFVVAVHEPSGYTFAGIDGGGYDFESAHYVKFAALRVARTGGTVYVDGAARYAVGPAER